MSIGTLSAPNREELLAFIDEQEKRLIEANYEVKTERLRDFRVLFGVCAQAIRFSAAFAVLLRAGRGREAVVLARQALEHASTAQWAYFTEGGIERLISTLQSTHLGFSSAMSRWLESDELAQLVEADRARWGTLEKGMPSVTDRLRAIDQRRMLETVYRQQSQLAHVTSTSTTGFLIADGEHFALVPDPADPHGVNTTYVAAMASMFAAWIVEEFQVGQPGMERLDTQSDQLKLPLNVKPEAH